MSKNRTQRAKLATKNIVPAAEDRHALLHGPYTPPAVRIGKSMTCTLRGKAKVCGWSDGPIAWPIVRVGHGGKGAYAMTPQLARAVRRESVAAVAHWWGVSIATVGSWRRALRVEQFNEGTRRLWSLWREPKLPDKYVAFSKAALRKRRFAVGMTQQQVTKLMRWKSTSAYDQLESGRRKRAARQTLARLAKIFLCRVQDLMAAR